MSARAKAHKTGIPPEDGVNGVEASVPPQPVDVSRDEAQPELAYLPAPDAPIRVPPPLVYPPVAEARPSSRPVFAVAFAALLLLVAIGVLLVRQGMTDDSANATVASSAPSATGADVISEVSFGPGLALSES